MGLAAGYGCGPKALDVGEPFPHQSIWTAPPRPALPAQADTNDANAYEHIGVASLKYRPDTAAAAFYWVTQLDPWRADAYYARAVALQRTLWGPDKHASNLWMPRRQIRLNEFQVVDSLNHLAYDLDPYIHRRFDDLLGAPVGVFNCARIRDRVVAGLCFIQSGDFKRGAQQFSAALKKNPKEIALHYVRAHTYYQLGRYDSAAMDLGALADSLGRRQEKKLTVFYISRAKIYYAQGMAYTQLNDTASARTAFERALVEDLGFHMASVRLAGRAIADGDTTAALNHLAGAVAVSPSDAPLRLYYGILLSARKQHSEAREQLRAAIEVNPHFAQPYLHLGKELESTDPGSAVASYDTFLLRSARSDPSREWVEQRLRRLVGSP